MSTRKPHSPPPRWLDKLVEFFCAPQLLEQVIGDLHERFYRRAEREGESRAKRMYWREVLAYMRPSIIKRKSVYPQPFFLPVMFKNYFIVTLRNFLRMKVYSGINILGLTIGLASSFFILLWVVDETSYDRFHKNGHQIHQAWRHFITGGQTYTLTSLPRGIADEMSADFPEVEETVITLMDKEIVVTKGADNYREAGGYVGASFFRIFSFPFLFGNPETALNGMTSAVITERTARKLFGEDWQSAVGRSITVDHRKEFTVTGVLQNVPNNSSLQFDILLPIEEYFATFKGRAHWYFMDYGIYAKLQEGTVLEDFNRKVADIFNRHADATDHQIFLQPFEDIYLHSFYRDGKLIGGRIEYVRIFTAVAIFILVIACINFMNLATARSSQRAREIGVRKVVGAHRRSLIVQFITESLAISIAAFLIALVIVVGLLPAFNYLTGKNFTPENFDISLLSGIVGITLAVGILSGSYPALYLSSFKPVAVMRGTFRQQSGIAISFRKGLVIFQFGLSVLLIVSTIVVYLQLEYNRTKNLGLERDNLLFMAREGALVDRYDAVVQELLMKPGISSVTASGQNPLEVDNNTLDVDWDGKDPNNTQLFYIINSYHDFAKTMGMELIAGRDFSKNFADSTAYLINEETARMISSGPVQDVVGKVLNVYGDNGPIVGVVKNFSMNSLYAPIEPVIIRLDLKSAKHLYLRTKAGETDQALEGLKTVYEKFNADYPLQYTFLDEQFEQRYRTEQLTGKLANIFAIIALFISCLGLFGLTSFTVEQRTKELGVRRVLGATVPSIVVMLSADFLKLVFIGFVIAIPATWYMTNEWLQNFADRIEVGAAVFLFAGLAVILMALSTVGWQSVKAARANPVESLRSE